MAVEIKLNYATINQIGQAAQDAALATMEALHTEVVTAQVMPMKDGTLQNTLTSVQPIQEEGQIGARMITDGPYARRLYFHPEYNFAQNKNANAQGQWYEPWLEGGEHEKFLPETFEKQLKERLP